MATTDGAPRLIAVDPVTPDPGVIAEAAGILRQGGLVAFPTETVYGLGADALDAAAVGRIFAAKGRPAFNPVIVHVADAEAARALVSAWPASAQALAERFWPGPVTMVLPKADVVPSIVTAGLDAVAIRVPAHPVALALLEAFRGPIAAPSANRSGLLSPTAAHHVAAALGDRVDLVLDAGPTDVGIESTVVDLTGPLPRILRPGLVGLAEISAVVGDMEERVAPGTGDADDAPRASPGLLDRHYAPRARLVVLPDEDAVREAARHGAHRGERVGLLLRQPVDLDALSAEAVMLPDQPAGYARGLYAALHELDARGCEVIFVAEVPNTPAWAGIRDRLRRAAQ